jgi:RNA polymerase sigma factor (sigma-70 family)
MNEIPDKPLSREEENRLAREGTEDARNLLVMHAMHEALAYAYRCCRGGLDQDDLFSLCYDSLQQAAKNFKPNVIRFFSYAKIYVRRGIAQMWRSKDVVRNASLHQTEDYEPSRPPDTRSMGGDQGGDDYAFHCDGMVHGATSPFERSAELGVMEPEFEKIHIGERMKLVQPIIDRKLNDKERMVLDLVYNGDLTYEQIGKLLGVCRERTRMIHFQAMKKIRCELMRKKTLFTE